MAKIKKATLRPRKVAIQRLLKLLNYKSVWLFFVAWSLPIVFVLIAHAVKVAPL